MPSLLVESEEVPVEVKQLHGRIIKVEDTMGDGACAVHSVFGEKQGVQFCKPAARGFLRRCFGPTSMTFEAHIGNDDILKELRHVLWQELVKPCALHEAQITNSRYIAKKEGELIFGTR